MIRLLKNEHMKIFLQKGTWALAVGLAVISFTMALFMKKILTGAGVEENGLGFLSFSTGFLGMLPFFTAAIAGAIVAGEFERGTSELPTTYHPYRLLEVGASWVLATFTS
ncbi:hypothetical protein CEF21_01120 [Bacillus sp. FJAT-42376]|uniref:hypothetical protein n=1 Tax=Bacillus sp. FJAT-42376 TaxID=2014076 RepID=UPI000F4D4C25|nr:hypothetical protein [Bacillus sp. FJAT-42376]AZB41051.1 hypothetical protein CEF21_01120 [Bacillus sp. FJAT-42376]